MREEGKQLTRPLLHIVFLDRSLSPSVTVLSNAHTVALNVLRSILLLRGFFFNKKKKNIIYASLN